MSKKAYLGTWVETSVITLVKQLAKAKGISQSEYLRQLILQDLDKRTVFTTKLKQQLEETT